MTQCVVSQRLSMAPCVLIRSTGFPFAHLDAQRMSVSTMYAMRLLALHQCREEYQRIFEVQFFPTILTFEQQSGASSQLFKRWYQARRCVYKSRECPAELIHELRPRLPEIASWLENWNALLAACTLLRQEYEACLHAELRQAREHLHHIVMNPYFQEALFLSNPNMYTIALPSYEHHYTSTQRPAKVRQLETRFYAYLQRFCAKNDTTSFFGPIDYGQVRTDLAAPLILERGTEGLSTKTGHGSPVVLQRRKTRMSYWAADILAQRISDDPNVQPYIQPQLQTGLTLLATGELGVLTTGRHIALSSEKRELIASVDGQRTMQEIINENPLTLEPLFQQLVRQGILTLQIKIPTAAIDPLAWLRDSVARLPEQCTRREYWLQALDAFAACIGRFPAASVAEKCALLQEIERQFVQLTQQKPRRGEGEIYADRLLVYDEAQGDITRCIVGKPLHDRLLSQLKPVLDLSASFSLLLQQVCRSRACEVFRALNRRDSSPSLPYLLFLQKLESCVSIDECLADPSVQNFLERLNRLIEARIGDDGYASLHASDIEPFLQPVPGGTLASPDIFLTSPDPYGTAAEDYKFILGELHYGAQVWCHFLTFYAEREELHASLGEALAEETSPARIKAALVHKRQQGKTFYFELPGQSIEMMGRSLKRRSDTLPVADLEVALVAGELQLRSRSRDCLVELYPGDPRSIANWLFGTPPVVCPAPSLGTYTPRVMIGETITWRASWQLNTQEILPSEESATSPADLFLHARGICKRYGLPDRCFVRISSERKPFYVDFTSLLSIEFFFMTIRKSSTVIVTEMLPTPDQWLLRGPAGERSCEWRMTFIYHTEPSISHERAAS